MSGCEALNDEFSSPFSRDLQVQYSDVWKSLNSLPTFATKSPDEGDLAKIPSLAELPTEIGGTHVTK